MQTFRSFNLSCAAEIFMKYSKDLISGLSSELIRAMGERIHVLSYIAPLPLSS